MFWRRRQPKKKAVHSFATVQGHSSRLRHFNGSLPIFKGAVRHTLFCCAIGREDGQALLDAGFSFVGSKHPTHLIQCNFYLAHSPKQTRCLFQLCLGLESTIANARDWVAVEVCKGLKNELRNAKDKGFLIRCKNSHEFPFCLDDETLDEIWLMNAGVHLRSALKTLDQITRND